MSQTFLCPHCQQPIELTQTLSAQLEKSLQTEFAAKEQTLRDELNAKYKELRAAERAKAETEAKKQLAEMQQLTEMQQKKLDEAREHELQLRKEKAELEDQKKALNVEVERKVAEREKVVGEKIQKQVMGELDEKYAKRLAERDQEIAQFKKKIEDLNRQKEQGSTQLQGDAQEVRLHEALRRNFPLDDIADVPTGVTGADLIHTVRTPLGQVAGKIVWESKQTKAWSEKWVSKLKDDAMGVGADLSIIVTTALPKGVERFGMHEGVWVCDYLSALALVSTLRFHLIAVSQQRVAHQNMDEKMQVLYQYLTSAQFRNRMETMLQSFANMQQVIEQEKRAMTKHWKSRQTNLDRMITTTATLQGELEGLMGQQALDTPPSLELPGLGGDGE